MALSPRWRRYLRRTGKVLAWGLAAAVVVLVVIVLALETSAVRGIARDQVQAQLDALFVGDVTVGEIAASPLRRIDVRDVRIDDADGLPAVAFDALVVEYSLAGALGNTLRIERVAIEGLEIWARIDADGQWNLAGLVRPSEDEPEPPSEPSPWVVVVDQLSVDGRVHAPDEQVFPLAVSAQNASAGANEISLQSFMFRLGELSLTVAPTRFAPPTGALDTAVELAVARATLASFLGELPGPAQTSVSLTARRVDDESPIEIAAQVQTGDGQSVAADLIVSPDQPAVRGSIAARRVDLEALLAVDVPSELNADIELDVAGAAPAEIVGTVSVEASGRLFAEPIQKATIRVAADRGAFELDLAARYAGVAADVDATVRLAGASVAIDDARATFAVADLARAVDGRAAVSGSVSLDIEARGEPDDISGRVKLEGKRIVAGDMKIGDVFVSSQVARQGDSVRVSSLVVRAAGAALRANASAEGEAVNADIGRLEVAVADVARLVGFEGRATGTVVVEGKAAIDAGKPNAMRGDLRLQTRGVGWGQLVTALDATFTARLRPRRLVAELEATDRQQPLGTLKLRVDARTPNDLTDAVAWTSQRERLLRSLELDWRGARIDAATLARYGIDVKAAAGVTAELDIADRGSEVVFSLAVADATSELLAAATDAKLDLTLSSGQLDVTVRTETAGVGTVEARARASAPARWTDAAAWSGAGPDWLQQAGLDVDVKLAGLRPLGVPKDVSGRVEMDVDVGPGAGTAQARLDATASSGEYGGPVALGLTLTAQPQTTALSLDLALAGDRLLTAQLEGQIGTQALLAGQTSTLTATPLAGTLSAPELDVPTLLALGGQDIAATGELDLGVTLSGTAADPIIDARINTRSIRVKDVAVPQLAVAARATREQVEARVSASGLALDAKAVLTEEPLPISATLAADGFELGWLAPLAAGLRGALSGRVEVSGTAAAPMASGELRLAELGADPIGPIDAIRNGDVVVTLEQTRSKGPANDVETRLEVKAKAKAGAGSIDARANAVLDGAGLRTARATLATKKLELKSAVTARLGTDVDIAVDRDAEGVLRGKVDIGDTLVVIDSESKGARELYATGPLEDVVIVGPDGEVLGPDGEPIEAEELERDGARAGPPRVVLDIDAPRTIQVFAPEGQLVMAADLTARAVPGFALEGTVTSDDGRVELFGRRYRLDRFLIGFAGDPANPAIDIRLSYEFQRFTMSVELSGTANEPELALSADPPIYDDPELLSFLLGAEPGAPADDSGSLQDQASAAAAGVLASQVQSAVKERLAVNVLRLELSEDSATAAKVTVGKWITRRLFVAFRHNFEAEQEENNEEARFEYRLLRNLLLEGYFGDQSAAGIDLLWIKRF